MEDKYIIKMYEMGMPMKYIVNSYYQSVNRNKSKPINMNGIKFFPAKIMNKSDCSVVVHKIIYNYIIHKDEFLTSATVGRGAELPF